MPLLLVGVLILELQLTAIGQDFLLVLLVLVFVHDVRHHLLRIASDRRSGILLLAAVGLHIATVLLGRNFGLFLLFGRYVDICCLLVLLAIGLFE